MATARELLEQADALMRRNRADALDDIPVLTDVMPAAQLRGAVPAPGGRPVVDAGPPSLPLLTDDIEVVEEDTVGADAVEGEPSAWLEFEDTEPSVIGDAPDSVAIVPPFERRSRPPDETLMASAEHEEIELTRLGEDASGKAEVTPADALAHAIAAADASAREAAAVAQAGREAAERQAAARMVEEHEAATHALAQREATEQAVAARILAERERAERERAERERAERERAEREQAEREQAEREQAERDAAARAVAEQEASARELAELEAATRPTTGPFAVAAKESAGAAAIAGTTPTPVATTMADDDERWVAAAEEIRMQVLQRIDLFTDAGLRDQLALRLQPIADRASADFVAAINLHVGDLLRTYVAEAIEREIERWRRDH